MLLVVLTNGIGAPPVPVTVTVTEEVPPTATGKLAAVVESVKLSVVFATVRPTAAVLVAPAMLPVPLPNTVMD